MRLGRRLRAVKTQIVDERSVPSITLAHHHLNQDEEWMLGGRWLLYQAGISGITITVPPSQLDGLPVNLPAQFAVIRLYPQIWGSYRIFFV